MHPVLPVWGHECRPLLFSPAVQNFPWCCCQVCAPVSRQCPLPGSSEVGQSGPKAQVRSDLCRQECGCLLLSSRFHASINAALNIIPLLESDTVLHPDLTEPEVDQVAPSKPFSCKWLLRLQILGRTCEPGQRGGRDRSKWAWWTGATAPCWFQGLGPLAAPRGQLYLGRGRRASGREAPWWVLTPKVSPPPGSLVSAPPLRARPGASVGSRRCRAEVAPSTTATTLPSCRRDGGHEESCGRWVRAASVYNSDLESKGLLLSACETADQKLRPDSGTAARPGRAAGRGRCGGGGGAIPTPLFTDPLVYR